MFCSSCKKRASKEHSLCDSCRKISAENPLDVQANGVVPEKDVVGRVKCEICLEKYQEHEMEQHREMCIVRLMFRCTVCDADYVSKEGLMNHLDLHEIADESKELHYQEIRAMHKLHLCVLCNDQRGYQENRYWNHIHDIHDGFFLRCSDCGESFQSQKLKTDHDLNHCKARNQTVTSDSGVLEADQNFGNIVLCMQGEKTTAMVSHGEINETAVSDVLNLELLRGEHSSEFNEEKYKPAQSKDSRLSNHSLAISNIADDLVNHMTEKESVVHPNTSRKNRSKTKHLLSPVENTPSGSSGTKCFHCGKEFSSNIFLVSHIELNHKPLACDICGITFPSFHQAQYHKVKDHTEPKFKCLQCPRTFHRKKHYDLHLVRCAERKFSCELCHQKFKSLLCVIKHMRQIHHAKEVLKKTQIDRMGCKEEQEQMQDKATSVEETSLLQPLVGNLSSETSGTKCSHCEKKFSDVISLANHIESNHLPLECDICGMKFSSFPRVQYHKMMKHTGRKMKCPHCPRIYNRTRDFDAHLPTCETKKFSCELCHEKFKAAQYVALHMKRFHRVKGALKKIQIDRLDSNEMQEHKKTTLVLHDAGANPSSPDQETVDSRLSEHAPPDRNNIDDTEETNMLPTANMERRSRTRAATRKNLLPLVDNSSSESSETECSHCGKEFSNAKSLFLHIKNVHKPTKCGVNLSGVDTARNHKVMKHPDSKYECDICSKTFRQKKKYTFHLTICDGKKVQCELCDLKFKTSNSLKVHMRRHHHDKEDSRNIQINLPSCKKQQEQNYAENIDLKMEITVEETTLMQQDGFGKTTDFLGLSQNAKDQEIVDSKPFSFDQTIADSQRNEHSPSAMNAAIDTDNLIERSETEIVSEIPLIGASGTKCSFCGKKLPSSISLARHIESSHVPVECDICGITLSSVSKARYHKNMKHMEPKHKCPHCPMKFHRKFVLLEHVSICVGRKFACDLCDKKFKSVKYVNGHKKKVHHVTEILKEVQVDLKSRKKQPKQKKAEKIDPKGRISAEEKKALQHDDLKQSSLSPSTITGAAQEGNLQPLVKKPSRGSSGKKCSHCGKEFVDDFVLARHIRENHRPHACGICRMTFSSFLKARYHKMMAHKEAKHKCPQCQKKFHQQNAYRAHLSTCERGRVSCELCDQKFKNLACVNEHMKVHVARIAGNEGQEQNQVDQINCPISDAILDQNLVSHHVEAAHQMPMCASCGMSFGSADQLNDHQLTCPRPLNNVDSQFKTGEIPLPHGGNSSRGSSETVCSHCDKDYYDKVYLDLHIMNCHQPVVCDICGVVVIGRNQLKYHKVCRPKEVQTDRNEFNELEKEPQTSSDMRVSQGENIDLKMEIEVDETTLQE